MSESNGGLKWPAEHSAAAKALLCVGEVAPERGGSDWDCAVSLARLCQAGLTSAGLRFLIRRGLVDHADEVVGRAGEGRKFKITAVLTFSSRTCVVLTPAGRAAALALVGASSQKDDAPQRDDAPPAAPAVTPAGADAPMEGGEITKITPDWDGETRRLTYRGLLVKQFKHRAPNQERLLEEFQLEGWRARIDDPLPPAPDIPPKQRLHDAINGLNRGQDHKLLKFRGDGTGKGVLWEELPPVSRPAASRKRRRKRKR